MLIVVIQNCSYCDQIEIYSSLSPVSHDQSVHMMRTFRYAGCYIVMEFIQASAPE